MRKASVDPILAAAYHEAGHAVMCHMLGIRLKSISIGMDELYSGETEHADLMSALMPIGVRDLHARLKMEKAVMLCMAGPLAQRKSARAGASADDGGTFDIEIASKLALRSFGSRKTAVAYLAFIREWVSRQWQEPRVWAAVERLARALIKARKLSGRQADAIIRGRHVDL